MISPCYECPERKLYCHSRCEEYLKFKESLEAAKKESYSRYEAVDLLIKNYQKKKRKVRLRHKK